MPNHDFKHQDDSVGDTHSLNETDATFSDTVTPFAGLAPSETWSNNYVGGLLFTGSSKTPSLTDTNNSVKFYLKVKPSKFKQLMLRFLLGFHWVEGK
jgi:hypothetical protein